MYKKKTVGVVVPCFNEESQIEKVVETIPYFVDSIICVDDASTDATLETLQNLSTKDKRISIVILKENLGVGGAIDQGYSVALKLNLDLIAVMAGDGQMNPEELELLIKALLETNAAYAKISRLRDYNFYSEIPSTRRLGNAALGFLTRISSGYWSMTDSQTGYTVITKNALRKIQGNLWKYYGFPNDVLNKLGLNNYKIVEIPSRPVYGVGEVSKLKPSKVAVPILKLLIKGIHKRVLTQYFQRTLHPIGMGYLFGLLGLIAGCIWLGVIFIFQFIIEHRTQPIQLMSAFFITQLSFITIWLSLIFDAIENKANSVMIDFDL